MQHHCLFFLSLWFPGSFTCFLHVVVLNFFVLAHRAWELLNCTCRIDLIKVNGPVATAHTVQFFRRLRLVRQHAADFEFYLYAQRSQYFDAQQHGCWRIQHMHLHM